MILKELAEKIGGRLIGDGDITVERCATLQNAEKGAITYVDSDEYLRRLSGSSASAAIVGKGMETATPSIEVENPALAFAKALDILHPPVKYDAGIHPTAIIDRAVDMGVECHVGAHAVIGKGSSLGSEVTIHACVVIGKNCSIGSGSTFHPGVVIYDGSVIGKNVTLHAGVVIGADGFRFVKRGEEMKKMPHVGIVRIGNNVEIGANSCVDRAMLDETVIGNGVKIDNLVQIGHNTSIGENSVIAGLCGISGSCKIGKNVVMGGQVGVGDHMEIADNVVLASKTGVSSSIKKAGVYGGTMAQPIKEWRKSHAAYRRGPETLRRLNRFEKKGKS